MINYAAGIAAVLLTERSRNTDSLTAVCTASDDSGRSKTELGGRNISARHKEVLDILGVVATVRNGVDTLEVVAIGGKDIEIKQTVGSVEVNAPACVDNSIVEDLVIENIVLVEDIITHKSAALAHSGKCAYPDKLEVVRAVLTAVLDVIPKTVCVCIEVVTDLFVILDDVLAVAHKLEPPVTVVNCCAGVCGKTEPFLGIGSHGGIDLHGLGVNSVTELMLGKMLCERRRSELNGLAGIDSLHKDGVTHSLVVCLLGSVGLAGLSLGFASLSEFSACEITEGTVTGAVSEDGRGDAKTELGGLLEASDCYDAVVLNLAIVHRSIEISSKIGLFLSLAEKDHIPSGIAEGIVYSLIFKHKLVNKSAFRVVGLTKALVSTRDMNSDLAGCVTAKHGACVDERGLDTFTSGSNSRAKARHTSADNDKGIMFFSESLHF